LLDTPPEHDVAGVDPAFDDVEYVLEHVGAVVKSLELSLLTNPEYDGEIDGLAPP